MTSVFASKEWNHQLKGRHFLTLADLTAGEMMYLIEYALQLKKLQQQGKPHRLLEGKTLAMIFEKPSTRTRVSFETGMFQLGGQALFLSKEDIQMGNGETISDTAKTLSRYVDSIMIRTFGHDIVTELARNGSIPIINGLTDDFHPCQVLADFVTIYEKWGHLDGKIAFVGDGNNMAHSLLMGCAVMGVDCSIAVPKGYEVNERIFLEAQEIAKKTGAVLEQTYDPKQAVQQAGVIYTDVWTSMGWEDEVGDRLQKFASYQVNEELTSYAKEDYLFLHCLPARRGEEVTTEIIDGPHSVVFDQAENRLHAQKAILASIIES